MVSIMKNVHRAGEDSFEGDEFYLFYLFFLIKTKADTTVSICSIYLFQYELQIKHWPSLWRLIMIKWIQHHLCDGLQMWWISFRAIDSDSRA